MTVTTPQSKRYHSLVHTYPKFEPARVGTNLSNGLTALVTFLKLKERLVRSVMSNQDVSTQSLRDLGSSVNLLSPKQISMIAWKDLKEIQENFTVQWTQGQMHALVKKKLSELKVSMKDSCSLVTCSSSYSFLIVLFLRVNCCQVRTWELLSHLQEVCQAVCSSMSKPRGSWMTQRPWTTFPCRWGRASWRPCCKGWVKTKGLHYNWRQTMTLMAVFWVTHNLYENQTTTNASTNAYQFAQVPPLGCAKASNRSRDHVMLPFCLMAYVLLYLYTHWRIKCFPIVGSRYGSPRAGAEFRRQLAVQNSTGHPEQSKHQLLGSSGEENMAAGTGNQPWAISTFYYVFIFLNNLDFCFWCII